MRQLLMLCLLVFSVARAAEAAIVIDGIVNEPEWATATSAVNTVTSNWTPADRLDRIRAFTDADYLYIAIDGEISVNAIILYVDSNPGDCSNLASCLTDNVGVLDDALSSALVAGAPFTADFGWGTRDMNRSSTGSDDRLGWRDLKQPSPSNFGWLYGTTFPSACGGGACETKIPLAILGGSGAIKLFARLGVPNGNYISNQNLPMDNPANPQAVNVWMGVPRSTPTPVPELLPMKLRLHPCQPNPFNPQTTVKYDLPEAGPVRLSVFDVAGRLVRTLVDESMPQGSHEVVWDERDATGREVGSGSYLARLEFGGKVETMTIGLVR